MKKNRFAVFGTGFWSNYQIPGWLETREVELVALLDTDMEKARLAGQKYGVDKIYNNPLELFGNENIDFVDIISDVNTHLQFTEMAAHMGVNVVCQKPMASSFNKAKKMVGICAERNVKLFINENFRWQAPIRKVKSLLDSNVIGEVFKGHITFCSAFPVFDNQPFLKKLDRFIIMDVGSHIFDLCRFLFGEVRTLNCLTRRINPDIEGEDVANVLMEMENGIHCFAEMSYASRLEKELFPQTLLLIEGSNGSIHLAADYEVKVTAKDGTCSEVVKPKVYDWVDPKYEVIHSSIVDAQKNILEGLKGKHAETTGEDNLETTRLVWAAYYSSENKCLVNIKEFK